MHVHHKKIQSAVVVLFTFSRTECVNSADTSRAVSEHISPRMQSCPSAVRYPEAELNV